MRLRIHEPCVADQVLIGDARLIFIGRVSNDATVVGQICFAICVTQRHEDTKGEAIG